MSLSKDIFVSAIYCNVGLTHCVLMNLHAWPSQMQHLPDT